MGAFSRQLPELLCFSFTKIVISTESERSDRVSFLNHFKSCSVPFRCQLDTENGRHDMAAQGLHSTFRCLLGSFPLGTVQTDQDIGMTEI